MVYLLLHFPTTRRTQQQMRIASNVSFSLSSSSLGDVWKCVFTKGRPAFLLLFSEHSPMAEILVKTRVQHGRTHEDTNGTFMVEPIDTDRIYVG